MRTIFRLGLALCFVAGPWAHAAPRLKNPPAVDRVSVVGEWVPDDGGRRHDFTAGGVLLVGDRSGSQPTRYAVNAKTSPAEFDLTHPDKKATWLWIYKVEGDMLTLCLSLWACDPRPRKFERSDAFPVSLQTYTRVKQRTEPAGRMFGQRLRCCQFCCLLEC